MLGLFYRRIHHVNPWMTQSHVDDVLAALHDFGAVLQVKNITGPGTAWPTFIAGSEVFPGKRREAVSEWIEKASRQTGLHGFRKASEQMKEVWRRRDHMESRGTNKLTEFLDSSCTWIAVSRGRRDWVLLC